MIGDDLAAALPALREQAESMMRDTVLVERPDGPPVVDPVTHKVEPGWRTIYEGKCRVIPTDFKDTTASAGETTTDIADTKIATPITTESGEIRNGDRATITAVDATFGDPANVGRQMVLQRDPIRTHPIERRFSAQEDS